MDAAAATEEKERHFSHSHLSSSPPPFSYFLSREEATATAFHVDDTAQFRITMPQEDGRKGGEGGEAPHCIPVREEIHPPEVKTDTSESILCLGCFLLMQRSGKGVDRWRFPALDALDGMW